jgi:hypothetical protein
MSAFFKHSAYVYDRGGTRKMRQLLPLQMVRWDRTRDTISGATVVVANPDPQCQKLLASIRAGRHELVIYRGGERVWEGPITLPTYTGPKVTIKASDVWQYVYRTIDRKGTNNAYPHVGSAVVRCQTMLTRELARKERLGYNLVGYINAIQSNADVKTSKRTMPYQNTVWEDIDALAADGGIDYTALGRSLMVWDTHTPIGRGPDLTDVDIIGDVIVSEYGSDLATYLAVTDGQGRWAAYSNTVDKSGADPYWGEWEILNTAYQYDPDDPEAAEPTLAELKQQAQRNASHRLPTPVVVRIADSSQVNPASVDKLFSSLVPGVWFSLRSHHGAKRRADAEAGLRASRGDRRR